MRIQDMATNAMPAALKIARITQVIDRPESQWLASKDREQAVVTIMADITPCYAPKR